MNAIKATMSVSCFRTFGLIVGWAALWLPVQAYALSLGGFQVDSALDEPLKGEIQLESVDAETLESLEVTLGSADDFQRADVPRAEFLQQLEFTVIEQSGGDVVVEVTSQQPMKEPFLHFLVSVEWSGGKLVREYTGLLDPPLYAGESPAEVETPAIESEQMAQGEAPAASGATEMAEPTAPDQTQTSVTPPATGSAGRSAEYGPTREGDTLWDIASRLDTGAVQANVFQIMIALQRQNPDAFIDNNVNRLKTGAILRLEDIAMVADVSPEQASTAYSAQLEQWRAQTQVASAGDEGDAAASAGTAMAEASPETETAAASGQASAETGAGPQEEPATAAQGEAAEGGDDVLRIVQAEVDEAEQSQAASAGSDRSGEIAELQSQIATLQESLESSNLENQELRERVNLLEGQLENTRRLIEIQSEELAAAQRQAAESQEQAVQAQEEAAQAQQQIVQAERAQAEQQAAQAEQEASAEQVAAQSVQPVEEAGQEVDQGAAQGAAQEETVEPMAEESAAAEEPDSATASSGESATQQTESSQQASAAAATTSQSSQSDESTQPVRTVSNRPPQASWWSQIPDMLFSSWVWMVGAGLGVLVLVLALLMFLRRRQSIAEFEESILSGSALDSYSETSDSAATSASDTSFLSDFGTAGMGTMQADEVDPLAEAEVYLAYGRDEQAEDVLKEAARRDPARSEVKLKLLEIYKQRNDVKSFETIAEELYPAGDSGDREVWNQVTAMGRELNPGNPLFQEAAAGGTPAQAPGAEESAPQPPAAATSPRPETPAGTGAGENPEGLSFDLDDLGPAREEAPAASSASAPMNDEFDLDLDTDTTPQTEPPASPASTAAASGDSEGTLNFGEGVPEQSSGSVDPATQPFPAPDEQTDLDRELERLASEREAGVAPAPTEDEATLAGAETTQVREADWEQADSDAGTLDFPASDSSDIDFDLNLDDSSIQQLSGSDTPQEADTQVSSEDDLGDGLLEFESDNIPPEETWAGPSTDAAPAGDEDSVSYTPADDVQSAEAPQYNEAETKLDLARAYLDMGDKVGARSIIDEVMREGDPAQRDQAAELASQL